jgi:hypothetical protein
MMNLGRLALHYPLFFLLPTPRRCLAFCRHLHMSMAVLAGDATGQGKDLAQANCPDAEMEPKAIDSGKYTKKD